MSTDATQMRQRDDTTVTSIVSRVRDLSERTIFVHLSGYIQGDATPSSR
jgi:hypothetical protein